MLLELYLSYRMLMRTPGSLARCCPFFAFPVLRCSSTVDDAAHALFETVDAGSTNVAGECLLGYAPGTTAPRRTCEITGVWSQVTGSCDRTPPLATLLMTCANDGVTNNTQLATKHDACLYTGAELFCPSNNIYRNAEWPSNVPAGTFVEGDFCKPGWSGIIGRECQANGQWSLTTTGECTRTLRSVREAYSSILHPQTNGRPQQVLLMAASNQ